MNIKHNKNLQLLEETENNHTMCEQRIAHCDHEPVFWSFSSIAQW